MPKAKSEGTKKHGDELEDLIERTGPGKRGENEPDRADPEDDEGGERSNS